MTNNQSIWHGDLVRLRGVEPADWETFYTWSLDTELDQLTDRYFFPASKEYFKKWTAELAARDPNSSHDYRWMIENANGDTVGTFNTHSTIPRNGTFSYGLGINRPYHRQGYASEAIFLVLRFFFYELGYQKVNAGVFSFNRASLALHAGLGFAEEGRLRRMIYTEGTYYDEIVFGMTREEFEANENFNRR